MNIYYIQTNSLCIGTQLNGLGRGSGRVGSDFLSEISGRVNVLPGQVGSKKSDPWTILGYWLLVLISKA